MSDNSRKRPRESASGGSTPSTSRKTSSSTASSSTSATASSAASAPKAPTTPAPVMPSAILDSKPVAVEEHIANATNVLERLKQLQKLAEDMMLRRQSTQGESDQAALKESLLQARNLLISLKPKYRQVQLDTETKKEYALKSQELLVEPHAQLQNLLYEKRHLLSEIKTCHSFKKAAEKEVELIPLEQFLKEAPAQFLPADTASEHEILMKRLQWELEQRKQLKKDLSELQGRKSVLSGDKTAKIRHLDTLREKVRDLELKVAPLMKDYGPSTVADQLKRFETHTARLLPSPLYNLLFSLAGWISSSEDKTLDVAIVGNEAEAAKEISSRSHPHRDLHRPHPLSVHMKFSKLSSTQPVATIKFSYLHAFDVVTVQTTLATRDADDLLVDLFPGDNGEVCPNPAAQFAADNDENTGTHFNHTVRGRAFAWAQWLCGYRHLGASDAALAAQKVETEKGPDSDQMDVSTDAQNEIEAAAGSKVGMEKGLNPVRFREVIEKIKEKIGMN